MNSIGRVQERDGVYELVVSEEISEAYLKSLSLLTQEEIVLDAVWKEMLEVKKKMGEIPEKNYGDLIAELSFPLKLSDAPDDFLRGMMLSLGSDKFAFKSPSYLAFKKEIIGGKEYIVCEFIVMGMKEDEITHVEKNNFIQIDGKWKMIF